MNENRNTENNNTNYTSPTEIPANQNTWNVPPQDNGAEYRPPYSAFQQQTQPQVSNTQPETPSQYSTSSGWTQPESPAQGAKGEKGSYAWNFDAYAGANNKPKKKKKGLMIFTAVLCGALTISLVSFASIGIYSALTKNNDLSQTEQTAQIENPMISLKDKPDEAASDIQTMDGKMTTESIVKQMKPSIVSIMVYADTRSYTPKGMGSGIVIRDDGYIVTNSHVVDNASGLKVQLDDGTQYEGRVVGIDSKTDLAVVKIDAQGLTPAAFGDSDDLNVGEKIIAMGTPHSLEYYGSVTQGIVSGLNRSITAQSDTKVYNYEGMIQIDANIYPGNSGGALINEYGQVVGINSAGDSGQYQGINFAIPSKTVQLVVNDLIAYGKVTGRAVLGINGYVVDAVTARWNHVPIGVAIESTISGTDISQKGVVPGDIITKIDGAEVTDSNSISKALSGKKPGDYVKMELYRPSQSTNQQGKFYEINVKLEEDMTNEAGNQQPTQQAPQSPEQQQQQEIEDWLNGIFG